MRIFRTTQGIIINENNSFYLSAETDWDSYINRDDLYTQVSQEIVTLPAINLQDNEILPPAYSQEVWAAGVTYKRSKEARMEEAKNNGGGADFYAKVYEADRPELFFKSLPSRVVGTKDHVFIRRDATWNVPEPELTLFITSSGKIVGYTIGNDMSSRDIEGQNPLYLPQAKCYDRSAAIGPALYITSERIDPGTIIEMQIFRKKVVVFQGKISIDQMKRKHEELVEYLFSEMSFPHGVYLMTGTCLVPPDNFTLKVNDFIRIIIDPIGVLENIVKTKTS